MLLIVAGGRDYWLTREEFAELDVLHEQYGVTLELCGCQTGADSCGKVWAILRGIPFKDFPADWSQFGKRAGPIRNEAMAAYAGKAGGVALFTGNRGTQDMHDAAVRHGLQIFDFRR